MSPILRPGKKAPKILTNSRRYQNYAAAANAGLVKLNHTTNAVLLSVDTTNVYPSDSSLGGRPSVRIESKETVNKGLVIGDFAHMPGSVCGAWPACKCPSCASISRPLQHVSESG